MFPAAADAKLDMNGDGMAAGRSEGRSREEAKSIGRYVEMCVWEALGQKGGFVVGPLEVQGKVYKWLIFWEYWCDCKQVTTTTVCGVQFRDAGDERH